jgi:hypothetical protein
MYSTKSKKLNEQQATIFTHSILRKTFEKWRYLATILPIASVVTGIGISPASAGSIDMEFAAGEMTLACINHNATSTSASWQFNINSNDLPAYAMEGGITFWNGGDTDELFTRQDISQFYPGGTRSDFGVVSYSDPNGVAPFTANLSAQFSVLSPEPPFFGSYLVPYVSALCDVPNPNIAFTFDTTGSMLPYLQTVKQAARGILRELDASGANYRVAVTDYKDFPDYPYGAVLPFSSDQSAITSAIDSFDALGGGDLPESAYSALIRTIQGEGIGAWDADADSRSIILLTDAAPHDPESETGYTAKDVIAAARFANVGINNSSAFSSRQTMSLLKDSSEGMTFVEENSDIVSNGTQPLLAKRFYPVRIFTILAGGNREGSEFYEEIAKATRGKVYYTDSADGITKALFDITGKISGGAGGGGGGTAKIPEPSSVTGLLVIVVLIIGMGKVKRKRNSLNMAD